MQGGAGMKISIRHQIPAFASYRAACVRSLYNVEDTGFTLETELPLEAEP
jgi:hypothetical protein